MNLINITLILILIVPTCTYTTSKLSMINIFNEQNVFYLYNVKQTGPLFKHFIKMYGNEFTEATTRRSRMCYETA